MMDFPDDLHYLDTHEYVRLDGEIATLGLSEFAIDQLGDIVFLELPDIGDTVEVGTSFGSIESVKAVEELYPAVSGTIVDRNETMITNPELLPDDPYGAGWLLKVRLDDPTQPLEGVLTPEEYRHLVTGE